jgi:hypothetical protein
MGGDNPKKQNGTSKGCEASAKATGKNEEAKGRSGSLEKVAPTEKASRIEPLRA